MRAGWLIVTGKATSGSQLSEAREIAATAGFFVESREQYELGSLGPGATAGGALVALAVVARHLAFPSSPPQRGG